MTTTHYPFTTRETYLHWRADWRRSYAELSQQIRDNKHALKKDQRENAGYDQARFQARRQILRDEATSMLHHRHEAKAAAGRLRAETLAARQQAA